MVDRLGDNYTSFSTENNHIYVLHQVVPVFQNKSCHCHTNPQISCPCDVKRHFRDTKSKQDVILFSQLLALLLNVQSIKQISVFLSFILPTAIAHVVT